MPHITYLLGAGASANVLPVYKNFKQRLKRFRLFLEHRKDGISDIYTSKSRFENHLQKVLDRLLKEMDFHSTPDTVAKKYFHQGDLEAIGELKAALVVYFIFEQTISQGVKGDIDDWTNFEERRVVDNRYDSFIATLLKPQKGFELQENVSVITWNYDYQFELTYKQFRDLSFQEISKEVSSYPNPFEASNEKIELKPFNLIHLNGVAFNFPQRPPIEIFNGPFAIADYPIDDLFFIFNHVLNYENGNTGIKPINEYFFFGWEKLDEQGLPDKKFNIYSAAIDLAQKTNVLVIVGYSFPLFNRAIDEMLLSKMKGIEKIYIQSYDAESIADIVHQILVSYQIVANDKGLFQFVNPESSFPIPTKWTSQPRPIFVPLS